ncbi:RHS repeat-associated core domain-containing protein [Chryseobacterium paludis]|uniref:RHS repeat-associated core domain-containing protein n=1 Tax=Chryseobacterium paludis TaxID=2956784 RepID=UPI0021BEAA7A|nr:RHS repeat-associated core domain-containing protein [Chryseobacterium paludis]
MAEYLAKTSLKDNSTMKIYNNKMKLFSSAVLLFVSILGFSQTAPLPYFHDTKGNIDVTNSGQLQFTVPIDVPPGVKNIAPKIDIVYSSGSGNGVVGYGGSISGIAAISRVGKTIEKDTIANGVQLDYSDYYSFNGQRLILKSGEYGKDGAEYVTEKYSNIKIKSKGAIVGQSVKGPEYWEVTFEDGSQAWYGGTAPGSSSARTPIDYNIVKLKDSNGNYISYNYVSLDNTSIIDKIEWGGNETLNKPHFNKIQFNYGIREKAETAYVKGVLLSQKRLLGSVVVSTGGTQFKKYVVTYKGDVQETGYKYIDKIQVFNSKDEPANPIVFGYEKSYEVNPDPNVQAWGYGSIYKLDSDFDLTGDFDGDGKLDIIRYFSTTSPATVVVPGIPQVGLYLIKDVYDYHAGTPVFLGNTISKADLRTATAVNIKKNNLIYNKQGFVIYKKVSNATTSKKDLDLLFYTVSETNTLALDFKKTIPDIDTYDYFGGGLSTNTTNNTTTGTSTTFMTILGIDNFDFNGDGLSELILRLNYKICTPNPDPTTGGANKYPENCTDYKNYIAIDLDENIPGEDWHYSLAFDDNYYINYKSGDFNGDGKLDFLKLDSDRKPYLVTLPKIDGRYWVTSNSFPTNSIFNTFGSMTGLWNKSLVGDYNGDGLSDLFIPKAEDSDLWLIYLSTGIGLEERQNTFFVPQSTRTVTPGANDYISIKYPSQFLAYDINNDGKDELVQLAAGRSYDKWWEQDNPNAIRYARHSYEYINVLAHMGLNPDKNPRSCCAVPGSTVYLNSSNLAAEVAYSEYEYGGVALNYQAASMMKKFVFTSGKGNPDSPHLQNTISQSYYDIAKEGRVVGITQAGITTNITYKELDKNINPTIYDITKTENYPYLEFSRASKVMVVSQLTQPGATKVLKQDFKYRGLVSHILGKGMIGFRQVARSSWYAEGFENTKIWSGTEIDPLNEGVPVKEWSIRTNNDALVFPANLTETNTQLLSLKSTIYQIDKLLNGQVVTTVSNANKAKVVTAILPKTTRVKNFLTNTIGETALTYGLYYLPSQSISKINTTLAVTTSTYDYYHNLSGIGPDYYIGRVKSKTDVVQAYGDSKAGKEEYIYESNRVKTVKKWNQNNTGNILETYNYDGFGNITQKIISNSVDNGTETTGSLYDTKGRFALKTTDNLGLETVFTYTDAGQILTQTDPFGNITTNTYDNWGKILTSTTNLGGTTAYVYDRDNSYNVTATKNSSDGNVSKKFINKLGQEYKVLVKAFTQGQFVSKETQFDELGRKLKESEPFFEGQNPTQWNSIAYDDSVFPSKVTATSFNGKQTETTISGFTTTVKELNGYGRTNSKTTDALGNIISTTDKGGGVQFSYNAAGQQIKAQYAENIVTTKYDIWGRKSEFNDPSNGVYKYEYNGFGQLKKTTSPKGTKEYIHNFLGQLLSQKETSTSDGGVTTNKMITYNYEDYGLINSKLGTSNGRDYSSTRTFDQYGRTLSSVENSNGKIYSQKGITYDNKGKVVSYEKELQSAGVITKVAIENVYSSWNGELYQVKDKISGKVLWELKETNARGQILKEKLGAVDITNNYNTATGYLSEIKHGSLIKTNLLNIQYQFDAIKGELNSRITGGDFNITETFDYDDNNRLINWTNPVTGVKVQNAKLNVYDIKGRILENDQLGTIKFENSAKVYQPTGMTLNAKGTQNYTNDLIQSINFNENNDPVFIDGEKGDVAFQYGLTSMRQRITYGGNFSNTGEGKFTKFYSEGGSFEVVKNNITGKEKHILYIGGTPYDSDIIYIKNFDQAGGSYKFLHKDYLGSIIAISDEAGNKLEQRHFDAWGNLTHLQIGNAATMTDRNSINSTLLLIDRGYTSHEHLSEVGIIHMNGRLYDPLLRRFLNADENIQDPSNTQNYNKYGYVMNNPVMYNDPNGEWLFLAGALIGGYLSGVQANGSWNPAKWDWKNNWSAILGGALGGAAISGALGNIVNNAGAIKNVLPGIISGGLNSAFTGSNFLGGMMGGITYTGNVFNNKITSTDGLNAGYKYLVSNDYNSRELRINSESMARDPLSIVLAISGLNPNAPANMYSLGIIASIFAPKDAWIAVANTNTMNEWAKSYVQFQIGSDGLIVDPRDSNAKNSLGITNPVTGRIILAPALFDGKKTNYGLGDVIIHEGKHLFNLRNGLFQDNNVVMSSLDEVSAYTTAGKWTGSIDPGINKYLKNLNNYFLKIQNLTK